MWNHAWYRAPWFHAKLLLVLVLSGLHGLFAGCANSPRTADAEKNSLDCVHWCAVSTAAAMRNLASKVTVLRNARPPRLDDGANYDRMAEQAQQPEAELRGSHAILVSAEGLASR